MNRPTYLLGQMVGVALVGAVVLLVAESVAADDEATGTRTWLPLEPLLAGLKEWMTQNSAVIMAVILLLIGVKLVGDAVVGLSE